MPDDLPPHPYRGTWEPARIVVTPAHTSTPWALRRELVRLRARLDRIRSGAELAPDADTCVDTIARLTEARDGIRSWARPTRGALVVVALALVGPIAIATGRQPHGWGWGLFAVALGAVAGALAEFWANRWLDLVAEYDGAIADLRTINSNAARPEGSASSAQSTSATLKEVLAVAPMVAAHPSKELMTMVVSSIALQLAGVRRRVRERVRTKSFWDEARGVVNLELRPALLQLDVEQHDLEGAELDVARAFEEMQKVKDPEDLRTALRYAVDAATRGTEIAQRIEVLLAQVDAASKKRAAAKVRVDASKPEDETAVVELPREGDARKKER